MHCITQPHYGILGGASIFARRLSCWRPTVLRLITGISELLVAPDRRRRSTSAPRHLDFTISLNANPSNNVCLSSLAGPTASNTEKLISFANLTDNRVLVTSLRLFRALFDTISCVCSTLLLIFCSGSVLELRYKVPRYEAIRGSSL